MNTRLKINPITYLPLSPNDELLQFVCGEDDLVHGTFSLVQPTVLQTLCGRESLSETFKWNQTRPVY